MSIAERALVTRETMLDYFVKACTPREGWLVGIEMEKIGRVASNGEPLPYDADGPTVRKVLELLLDKRGGNPIYEADHLIGLDGNWGTISLEPGGQVEWSSRPASSLGDLAADLDAHLAALGEAGSELGVNWLSVGVDPIHPVDRMCWMPKARYKIMRPYMAARGRLAHRMMTQTASIQCSFDFENLIDWARKFRAGALMAPLSVAMFANSSQIDGRDSGYRSYRQAIWRETEPDRCGLPAIVFRPGFGVEAWVDWTCRVPSMFRHRSRGLVPSGGVPFIRLVELTGCDALKAEDWELHLSSIFTEVRSYNHIEVRSNDLQPDHRIITVPTFWTGILYDEGSLEAALELGSAWDSHEPWLEAMDSAARLGVEGTAGGRPIRELAARALELSAQGLRGGAPSAGSPEEALRRLEELAQHLRLDPKL